MGLGPEDIIALHFESLDDILAAFSYREQRRAISDANQFLLEMMIAYGVKYREYLELRINGDPARRRGPRPCASGSGSSEVERLQREKIGCWE